MLDEISEMPMNLQAKLLRVIQEKEVERLGGKRPIKLNVRLVSTSNRRSHKRSSRRAFSRRSVLPTQRFSFVLATFGFSAGYCATRTTFSRKIRSWKKIYLTPKAQAALRSYSWPGNARELENVIQRSLILCGGTQIDQQDLHFGFGKPQVSETQKNKNDQALNLDLQQREFDVIQATLMKYAGDKGKVAKVLGISPRTLRYKLAKMRESVG